MNRAHLGGVSSSQRLEHAPRNAARPLSDCQHGKRRREEGDEDGACHEHHSEAVRLAVAKFVGEKPDNSQTDDLTDERSVDQPRLPGGRDGLGFALTVGVDELLLTEERVDDDQIVA